MLHGFRMILLRGYGWKRRKTINFGEPVTQQRDPSSYVWGSGNAVMRLLLVQVMDEAKRN